MRDLSDTLEAEQKKASYIPLAKIVLSKPGVVPGWVSPTGHNDPDGVWTSEALAYDDDTDTRATLSNAGRFLELNIASILCSKIRVYAYLLPADRTVDVDLYYNSTWNHLYNGTFTNNTWVEIEIGSTQQVTKARITFSAAMFGNAYLYEFDFYGEAQTYGTERILDLRYFEGGHQNAEVLLTNSDGALTSLDLTGYQGVVSLGFITSEGEEYSPRAPLWVIPQQLLSTRSGKYPLLCRLSLAGIFNFMAEDRASADYVPDSDDSKTAKTLIREICGDTGVTMLACFNHCASYDVVFDSEDSLIDVFEPKDSFSVRVNERRESKLDELLSWTQCVKRAKADGKIHIFVPEDETLDYEYSLARGEHTFFDKTLRKRVVIPGKITVSSHSTHEEEYSGSAQVDGYDDLPDALKITDTRYLRLASDDQGEAIATALLAHAQWDAETGYGSAPINVGAEVHDYNKITDSRQGDSRTGNIGYLAVHYRPGYFDFEFRFGSIYPGGLAGTMPPASGGARPSYEALWEEIARLWAIINQILAWLRAWKCPLENYIYINTAGDICLKPEFGRWVQTLGDLSVVGDKKFGMLLAVAAGIVEWYTAGGTLEHVFGPDVTGHGKIGRADREWLEGHIKKIHCDTEMYIPAEA